MSESGSVAIKIDELTNSVWDKLDEVDIYTEIQVDKLFSTIKQHLLLAYRDILQESLLRVELQEMKLERELNDREAKIEEAWVEEQLVGVATNLSATSKEDLD